MKIRDVRPGDAAQVKADLQKMWRDAASKLGQDIWELAPIDKSDRLYAVEDGRGKCLGIIGFDQREELPAGTVAAWMINSEEVLKRPVEFLRATREILKKVFAENPYQELKTWVGGKRKTNLNYLTRWHGFEIVGFHEPCEKAPDGYYELVFRRDMLK